MIGLEKNKITSRLTCIATKIVEHDICMMNQNRNLIFPLRLSILMTRWVGIEVQVGIYIYICFLLYSKRIHHTFDISISSRLKG